jgi:hypothetical protein
MQYNSAMEESTITVTEPVSQPVHEPHEPHKVPVKKALTQTARRYTRIAILTGEYIFDEMVDALVDSVKVIQSEARLFVGVLFTIAGLMNFSNGKYCDGNAADYLSCTRPTVYYYYGAFETFLVIVGVTLVLVWYFKRQQKQPLTLD